MPGFASTHNRFKSRIPEISKKLPLEFRVATREGAEVVKELAVAFAPRGGGDVHLQDAIHVEQTYEASSGRVLTWVVAWSRQAWYGHFVEYGTIHTSLRRGHARGWSRTVAEEHPDSVLWRVNPNPFMERAALAGREAVVARCNRAVKQACDAGTTRV